MDKVSLNLIRILSAAHHVTLVVPVDENTDRESITQTRKICSELATVPVKNLVSRMKKTNLAYWLRFLRVLFNIPSLKYLALIN